MDLDEALAEQKRHSAHYEAIGAVVAAWTFFETTIDIQIWRLAEIDQARGACITSQIAGHARKLDAVFALLRRRETLTNVRDRAVNRFCERASGLSEQRNRVTHDLWMVVSEPGEAPKRLEISARRRLVFETKSHPTSELTRLATLIHSLSRDLIALVAPPSEG